MPTRRVVAPVLLLVLILTSFAAQALAQSSWAVAERTDEQIVGLVAKLEPFIAKVEGGPDAAAVILYSQLLADAGEKTHKLCRNFVLEIRDPSALPDRMLRPSVGSGSDVDGLHAFVMRDGKVERRFEGEVVEGREEIGVGHASFEWGDLSSGDVIGWSLVFSRERPYGLLTQRMADTFPIVYSAVSVTGNDQYAYKLKWRGMKASEMKIKEKDPRDSRPMTIKINARVRAAIENAPERGPFGDDMPHVILALEEVYIDPESPMVAPGWLTITGWNQSAAQMSAGLKKIADDTKGLDITLSAITTGKRSAHEKAGAITKWVRDSIQLLEGPGINENGFRDDISSIVRSKEGTRVEKGLVTAVMLIKAEVPFSLASFRDPAHGPIDEEWENSFQFEQSVLLVTDEGVTKFYAPQCADCEPGTLPAEWVGVRAVVFDSNLAEIADKFTEAMRSEAMASGTIDLEKMHRVVEAKNWARFESLGQ